MCTWRLFLTSLQFLETLKKHCFFFSSNCQRRKETLRSWSCCLNTKRRHKKKNSKLAVHLHINCVLSLETPSPAHTHTLFYSHPSLSAPTSSPAILSCWLLWPVSGEPLQYWTVVRNQPHSSTLRLLMADAVTKFQISFIHLSSVNNEKEKSDILLQL